METYYGQRRTYFHNVRFSGMQEKNLQERRKKFRLITATLGNRMNELITLLGEGHEKDG